MTTICYAFAFCPVKVIGTVLYAGHENETETWKESGTCSFRTVHCPHCPHRHKVSGKSVSGKVSWRIYGLHMHEKYRNPNRGSQAQSGQKAAARLRRSPNFVANSLDKNPTSLYTTDDRTIRLNQDKTTFRVSGVLSIGTTPIGAVESVAARVESVAARQMSSSGLSASTGQPQTSSHLYYILLLAPSVLLHITFSSELHITYYIYYLVMGPNTVIRPCSCPCLAVITHFSYSFPLLGFFRKSKLF